MSSRLLFGRMTPLRRSAETESRVEQVAKALSSEGAKVDEAARPGFDPDHSHEIYGRLLHSTMAAHAGRGL